MCFSRYIYSSLVRCTGRGSRLALLFSALRKARLFAGDPVIEMRVAGKPVFMRLSHELPRYRASFPHYDSLLERISAFISAGSSAFSVIDVGANIGDSMSIMNNGKGSFLCIEADDEYYPLLERNSARYANVRCVLALCGEKDEELGVSVARKSGTSSFSRAAGAGASCSTLDTLLAGLHQFRNPVFLKIDTDGYDYMVMRGAAATLARARPLVLFELYPQLLKNNGEEPCSIFPFLAAHGYSEALFYDNQGFCASRCAIDDGKALAQLIAYASMRHSYWDVLLFHGSRRQELDRFYAGELEFFSQERGAHEAASGR
jgi:FkbM family methyltransferase